MHENLVIVVPVYLGLGVHDMGWSSQAALVHMPAHMMKLLFPWLSETLEARDDSNNRFPFAC